MEAGLAERRVHRMEYLIMKPPESNRTNPADVDEFRSLQIQFQSQAQNPLHVESSIQAMLEGQEAGFRSILRDSLARVYGQRHAQRS